MPDESEFEVLLSRVAGGSESAVWELLERYSKNILRTVRRRLPAEIRSKVDSIDIVQSVWKSFLRRSDQFGAFATSDQLIAYIASMARTKVYETHRHYTKKECRSIRREVSRNDCDSVQKTAPLGWSASHIDRRTDTPSAIVQAQESWQCAIQRHGGRLEQIVQLKLSGE